MNEEFVTYEIALKLKEKGFDEECLAYYTSEYTLYTNKVVLCDDKYLEVAEIDYEECLRSYNTRKDRLLRTIVDAPTIPQVLKWLRKKKIVVSILPAGYNKETGLPGYYYVIYDVAEYFWKKHEYPQSFETWEECELSAIEYVLDNLI